MAKIWHVLSENLGECYKHVGMVMGMVLPYHTHRKLFWLKKVNPYRCVSGCGRIIATPIGHHYACQKLIYGLIRLKVGIWSPSNRVSIINYMWVWQCV